MSNEATAAASPDVVPEVAPEVVMPKWYPDENSDTAAWWEATRDKVLMIQRCDACGNLQHYPRHLCISCGSLDHLGFVTAKGTGRVVSHSTIYRAARKDLTAPYTVALVQLDEGPTMLTGVSGDDPASIACDQRVNVDWQPMLDGRHLPLFRA